jgi:hypothetical protein
MQSDCGRGKKSFLSQLKGNQQIKIGALTYGKQDHKE